MKKEDELLNSDLPNTQQSSVGKDEKHVSVGQMLRAAREEQGIDLGLLASSLKVSIRQLELLESDDYASLPDVAFTRNFAISVAKRLKVDTKIVAQQLPKLDTDAVSSSISKISQDARGSVMKDEVLPPRQRSKAKWWLMLGLALILLGLFFLLPQLKSEPSQERAAEVQNLGGTSVPVQLNSPRVQPTSTPAQRNVVLPMNSVSRMPAVNAPAVVDVVTTATDSQPTAQDVALAVQDEGLVQSEGGEATAEGATLVAVVNQTPAIPDASSSAPTTTTRNETQDTLEIKTRTESWLRVTAATGETLYQNNLKAGVTYSVVLTPEKLPLSIRLGKAKDATVMVRGRVFDFSSSIVGDVANFKVK